MPKPRRPFILDAARRDLKEIAEYSQAKRSAAQSKAYLEKIGISIRLLTHQPRMGVDRHDYGDGTRTHVSGQHIILYNVANERVNILRVIHHSMDLQREIERTRSKSIGLER